MIYKTPKMGHKKQKNALLYEKSKKKVKKTYFFKNSVDTLFNLFEKRLWLQKTQKSDS